MTKKKPKLEYSEKFFDNLDLSDEEKEDMKKEIEETFANCDDPSQLGEPITFLQECDGSCPNCGERMEQGPVFQDPETEEYLQIFECEKCDIPFISYPKN